MTDELRPIQPAPPRRAMSKVVMIVALSFIALVVLAGVLFVLGLEGY